MKVNIKAIVSTLILVTAAISTSVVYADPQFSIQEEAESYPKLTKAFHEMNNALKDLEETPNEFGGNKAKAIVDLKSAIALIRKALDYHLQIDEDRNDGSMMQ